MSTNLNLPLFAQATHDKRASQLESNRNKQERFGVSDEFKQDSADIFGDDEPIGWTPEQVAARLVLMAAFAKGEAVYVEESNLGKPHWKRLDKCSFTGPAESYSLDPNRAFSWTLKGDK